MSKKLNLFYRISRWAVLILLACNILVKAVIWFTSLDHHKDNYRHAIYIRQQPGSERFTTKSKQELFEKVDYFLAPAFTILFAVIAVKLINTPKTFETKD